ncbi:MAG: aromatic amino acid transport family protein [Patescibacteria group bacterium]|jgi:tyrosine-specific transport protein
MSSKKHPIFALAMFVGTVIGVGLFGLPYVGSKVGFPVMVIFLILMTGLSIVIHLFFAELASKTKGLHRLPGYAEVYFGPGAKRATLIVQLLDLFGALLAYLIIGGQFLAYLFDGSVILYTFIFLLLGAMLIWRDQKSIGTVELILLVIFLAVVIFFSVIGFGHIQPTNLSNIDLRYLFLPYGVVVFSLWGTSIIPEIKEMLDGDMKKLRKVLITGIVLCAVVYVLFTLVVLGVSGSHTTADAISGLRGDLGDWVLKIGYLFGILTTFTSFITLGLTVKKLFWYDYGVPKRIAWFVAVTVPILMFVSGLKDFITVIGLTGAVMLGLEGVLITLIYLKIKKKESIKNFALLEAGSIAVIVLLSVGVVLEVFFTTKGF